MTPAILLTGLFTFRIVDIIDIILFAVLLYEIYHLVKGTAAIRIFIGIIAIYLVWKVVKAFQMHLLTEILGQFISVGVIAAVVVFQPEIRQFLLMVGDARIIKSQRKRFLFWKFRVSNPVNLDVDKIVKASQKMAESRTGALIVIARQHELKPYAETGQLVNARVSEVLLETIFFKNGPLHDGAVIIVGDQIRAARCILPISNRPDIPSFYGLRHRAAAGITEKTDAIAIIVSEQRGKISYSAEGRITGGITPAELSTILENLLK